MFQEIEPFYGWLHLYSHEQDEYSPFHGVEHNLFYYDRFIYTYPTHPLWDTIESESLLVKILYADYERAFAVVELLGEWNDLHLNDGRLLLDHVLYPLNSCGITRFVLIGENVFHAHLDSDDYYEELAEVLQDDNGWVCLLRLRPEVQQEFMRCGLQRYLFWSPVLDELPWRKRKPWQLLEAAEQVMAKLLG